MRITKRTSRAAGVLMACIMGLVVGVAAPAQAALGDKPYWSQFPIVQQGRYPNTNLVRFWQRIVWSDINTGQSCSTFVDGAFGPNTATKTRAWQTTFKIEVDGSVGPQTWSRAQSNLRLDSSRVEDTRNASGTGKVITFLYYYYVGKLTSFYVAFAKHETWSQWIHTGTTYEPWEFHNCSNWLTPVSW